MKRIARFHGQEIAVEVERHGGGYRVKIGDRWVVADLAEAGWYVHSLRLEDGTQYSLVHHREGSAYEITLNASTFHVDIVDPLARKRRGGDDELGSSGIIKALMPGRISRVLVEKGAVVRRGTGLLVLEAMKMENEIVAPTDGVVDEVFVTAGETVEGGADLMHITPD